MYMVHGRWQGMVPLLREQASITTQGDCHAIADLPLVLAFTDIADDPWRPGH
jgi:hypothetical protein